MSFARLRGSGLWIDLSTISTAEFEALDDHQSKALDGTNGGAYSLSSALHLGGSGLGNCNVTGGIDVKSGADITVESGGSLLADAATTDLVKVSQQVAAWYGISGTSLSAGSKFTLAEAGEVGGFTVASNEVEVPQTGLYFITLYAHMVNAGTANPQDVDIQISLTSSLVVANIRNTRFSATAADGVLMVGTALADITTPASEKVRVVANDTELQGVSGATLAHKLTIVRVGPNL
jgi:hypothetical protein